jgi:Flp pilus assembly protein TadB
MARQSKGPQRRPVKGFRPGKEPPQLRKQAVRQQMGEMTAAQNRLADIFTSRSPAEGRALMRRWRIGMLVGGVVLLVGGVLLYAWSLVAAVVVQGLALVPLFLAWRLTRQKASLDAMADALGAGAGSGKKRR